MQTLISNCDCGATPINAGGETICPTCGIVQDDPNINYGQDVRAFTIQERETRRRTGQPLNQAIHDKGLTTMIGRVGRDARGNRIKQVDKLKMLRLRSWQIRSRVHSSKDRNLAQAMAEFDRLSDKLSVSHAVKEKAAVIYRKALDSEIVRGRSINRITAASLYVAIRMEQIPRTLKQVVAVSSDNKKDISRCYRLILKTLGLKMPRPDAKLKVSAIANKLDLSMKIQHCAIDLIREAEKIKATAGKDPTGLAAAALYVAIKINKEGTTQRELADAAQVTEVTIRNRYKGFERDLGIEF